MYKKTHVVFFVFHLVQFYYFPYECPGRGGVAGWEKNNPECHLPEVIWDMFRHYFLYIGKSKDWAFLR